MSESTRTSRAPAEKRLTYQQWKRRKMLRLARNWVLFLAGCAAVVALLTGGILWLLPKVHGLLAGPKVFAASVYDGTDYVFNAADARLVLVNANLPYTAEPAPLRIPPTRPPASSWKPKQPCSIAVWPPPRRRMGLA